MFNDGRSANEEGARTCRDVSNSSSWFVHFCSYIHLNKDIDGPRDATLQNAVRKGSHEEESHDR